MALSINSGQVQLLRDDAHKDHHLLGVLPPEVEAQLGENREANADVITRFLSDAFTVHLNAIADHLTRGLPGE